MRRARRNPRPAPRKPRSSYKSPRPSRSHFHDKTVWIIGASSGIGAQVAHQLSTHRGRLLLSSRNEQELQRLADRCRTNGARCKVAPLDLTHITDNAVASALYKQATQHFPTIDCVILCAAVSQRARFIDTTPETIGALLQTDLASPITIAHEITRHFCARGDGRVVFVGSLAGYISAPLRSIYSASKAALHSLAKSLALEARPHGVRIQLIVPGFIRTPISLHALRADGSPHLTIDRNQRHGMDAERCAKKIVRFLASKSFELRVGLGAKGRIALLLNWLSPALLRRLLGRTQTI